MALIFAEVLATDFGPHPSDKWAAVTARQIARSLIEIDENSDTPEAAEARKARAQFEIDMAKSLESYFESVRNAEKQIIKETPLLSRSDAMAADVVTVDRHLDGAVGDVAAAATGTPFEDHFKNTDVVQPAVQQILQQNLIAAASIERSWSLDAKGL